MLGAALLLSVLPSIAPAQTGTASPDSVDEDPIYAPTPMRAVYKMLEVAGVTAQDTLYDLGSGDGRIVIAAAKKYGTRGIGIEINPERVREARRNVREAGVSDLVTIKKANIFNVDISDATVVTIYLLPETMAELRPKILEELEPGTPVVSHDFRFRGWEPERTVQVRTPDGWKETSSILRWTVPESPPAHLRQSSHWLEELPGWKTLVGSDR